MPAFHYIGMTAKGSKQKGVIEADNIKLARLSLRNKNIILIEIKPTQSKIQKAGSSRKQSMTVKELALTTRQLATLISAGLPIEEVLSAVAEQTEKPKTKGLLLSVRG